jgi:hypothetical protein
LIRDEFRYADSLHQLLQKLDPGLRRVIDRDEFRCADSLHQLLQKLDPGLRRGD